MKVGKVLETTPEKLSVLERCYEKESEAVIKLPKDVRGFVVVDNPTRFALRVTHLYGSVRVILEGDKESGIVAGEYISGNDLVIEVRDLQTLEEMQAKKIWQNLSNRSIVVSLFKDGLGREVARIRTISEAKKKDYDYLLLI